MKRLHFLLVATAVVACSAPEPGAPQPGDFAYGMSFDAPSGAPFVHVIVPPETFTETAWPDLRDLRVFNAAGEAVPFARIAPSPTRGEPRRIMLRSFRLDAQNPGGVPRVELEARARGVELRVAPAVAPDSGVEYVLATSDEDKGVRVERLLLRWRDDPRNWQQKVTVSVSRDLQSWNTVAFRRPIMDLRTADGERLTHGEVAIDRTAQQSGRYWRLTFDAGFSPALTDVEGEMTADEIPAPGVPLSSAAVARPDGTVEYQLPTPQPVARVRITPQDVNSVLPLVVEIRRDEQGKWEHAMRTVAYRINSSGGEQYSEPVRLGGQVISAVRLRPVGTSWGALPPLLTMERDATVLVVNARGSGPFLLAWGARAAGDAAVPLSTLVPGDRIASDQLPEARLGLRQELGGPSRLTALAPAERAAQWQTMLVWVMLVGGALALAYLAWRLFRETQTTGRV